MSGSFDYVIGGAGILGLSLARSILQAAPGTKVALLEKERALGKHGSGRNSGVLHSGIYYPESSLKAKLCAEGAKALGTYCDERKLPIQRVGKVILPVRAEDDPTLDLLLSRAAKNGARARPIDADELREIEPLAHTITGRAIHVPDCAVVDSVAILEALAEELASGGAKILFGHELRSADVQSSKLFCQNGQVLRFGHFVNAAGLHADEVAHLFGVGEKYAIMPFKGLYYDLEPELESRIRGLIYPVPDLRLPFLGVHLTRSVKGRVSLGPNALPALGRENYGGVEGVDLEEAAAILARNARQYFKNEQGFRQLVHEELRRLRKSAFVAAARALVPDVRPEALTRSKKVGIRAQLFDKIQERLVMDFLIERGPRSTHILNAVSPGFTCGPSFARHVAATYLEMQAPSWDATRA